MRSSLAGMVVWVRWAGRGPGGGSLLSITHFDSHCIMYTIKGTIEALRFNGTSLEWSTTSQRLWVYRISVRYAQKDPRFLFEKKGILVSRLNNRW